jgi:hypothetical protein
MAVAVIADVVEDRMACAAAGAGLLSTVTAAVLDARWRKFLDARDCVPLDLR